MHSVFKGFNPSQYNNPKYDYEDLLTGLKLKSKDFTGASLVIGNAAVLLSGKESSEVLSSKYYSGVKTLRGGETGIKESDLMTAPVLIDLHVKGSKVPDYLINYLPDINKDAKDG